MIDERDYPEPTCCDRCLEPLDDAPLGTVELITMLGVWCRRCEQAA